MKTALVVKNQFEKYLGLEITGDEENLLESGSSESRRALVGHSGCGGGKFKWILRRFLMKLGLKRSTRAPRVWIDTYYPLLNYPISQSLSLIPGPGSNSPAFTADLTENEFVEDPARYDFIFSLSFD